MNAGDLRALQAPLKDRYRAEPAAAKATLRAQGALDDSAIACNVETGRAIAAAGLHPATGGTGMELCSGDMLQTLKRPPAIEVKLTRSAP
jgi:hypothetical protein